LSTGWSHPVDKKSLQIQKLEPILVAQIEWIRAEYALELNKQISLRNPRMIYWAGTWYPSFLIPLQMVADGSTGARQARDTTKFQRIAGRCEETQMAILLPRRTVLKGLASALGSTGSLAGFQTAAWAAPAPYPAALTSCGLTNWTCVFNPDLTLPVSHVIGPDAVRTPLSYRSPPHGGYFKYVGGSAPYSTGPNGLTIHNTHNMQGSATTMDYKFNGKSWGSPVYFEASYTAPYLQVGSENWVATVFAMSEQAFNPAYGGNPHAIGTLYNRCEFDLVEAQTRPDLASPLKYAYYFSTLHANTGGAGPARPDVLTGTGIAFANTPLWHSPVTWGGLWGDGTGGTTNECQIFLNNTRTGKFATPSAWTSPAPYGAPRQWLTAWMDVAKGTRPKQYSYYYTLHFMRVWTPAT
jgi:hypothetical protein